MSAATLPSLLQSFFTERLLAQRRASEHTVASYRDTFRLLFAFTTKRLGKQPSALALDDVDAALIAKFLDHLERDRGNSARSRNVRLAALHSFFRYVAMNEPAHLLHCQRVLAIPSKRYERRSVGFLDEDDIEVLLKVPDLSTWQDAATARCCCSRPRQVCASRSSSRFAARISPSAPVPTCAASARVASSARRR